MVTAYKNVAKSNAKYAPTRPLRENEVQNSESGIVFEADKWTRLVRFLIIGSENGSFYISESDLTFKNYENLLSCISLDGPRVVKEAVDVLAKGRAPKSNPAIFALAAASVFGTELTKQAVYKSYPRAMSIPTNEALFATFRDALSDYEEGKRVRGGMGSGYKRAIGRSFNGKTPHTLAYHALKYPSRYGWAQADLLKLARPTPVDDTHAGLFNYIVHDVIDPRLDDNTREYLEAANRLKSATEVSDVVALIADYKFPREVVPTNFLNERDVWDALFADMPLTAMIRNLNKMTSVGLLTNTSAATKIVVDRLLDEERLIKARVHPIKVLAAMKVYGAGRGVKGSLTWTPVSKIINALDEAFHLAFGTITPTNKRICLALDVSGSMSSGVLGMDFLSAREVAAAMAMVIARTEPKYELVAYSNRLIPLNIKPHMRLDEVLRVTNGIDFGGTYCALPIKEAYSKGSEFDAFVSITDSETYDGSGRDYDFSYGYYGHGDLTRETRSGPQSVNDWLLAYREKTGIATRHAVLATSANEFTLGDPNDPLQLNIAGMDSSVPDVLSMFIGGQV